MGCEDDQAVAEEVWGPILVLLAYRATPLQYGLVCQSCLCHEGQGQWSLQLVAASNQEYQTRQDLGRAMRG